ncbi:MAG: hypothetical protein E7163_01785 [Firmicutes bacterium]|nr:hypothetical protein [Bacillota bacterium]
MKKKYKIWLILIVVLLVLVIIIGIISLFLKPKENQEVNSTNVLTSIEKYKYTLDDRDTKYMKDTFIELENILNSEEINYNDYAQVLSKLFVIDFYTLNNKINKYDIGGLEYILTDKVDMFKNKAMDTIYKDIIDNTYKDRIQELPEITEVKVIDFNVSKININDAQEDCYEITLEYKYKKDLGYDSKGIVYIIKNGDKLEIAKYEALNNIEEQIN